MLVSFALSHRSCAAFFLTASFARSLAAPASQPAQAVIDIDPEAREMRVWPEIMGINLDYGGRTALGKPEAMQAVKSIGIKSIRFPNGCEADKFDWRADNKSKMTVDQFLAFCEAVGAEPENARAQYYLGMTLLNLKRPAEAAQSLKTAADLAPTSDQYRMALVR